jgi:Pyridoxamine 5'-phosphate oxidase like
MSDTDRVWELMKKVSICMFASWDGQEMQARPMGAYVRPEEHAVFFLADARQWGRGQTGKSFEMS